jgi:hypothetical protein
MHHTDRRTRHNLDFCQEGGHCHTAEMPLCRREPELTETC